MANRKSRKGRPRGTGGKAAHVTPEQVYEVADALERDGGAEGYRNRCLWLLGIELGFRAGELLSLRVRDVWSPGLNRPLSQVTIDCTRTKTRRSRTVSVSSDGRVLLIQWMMKRGKCGPGDWLFPSSQRPDQAVCYKQIAAVFQRVREGLGMPRLSSHSMRRSGANLLRLTGADLVLIQQYLGHTTLEQTRAYLGVAPEEMVEASERKAELLAQARERHLAAAAASVASPVQNPLPSAV